MQVLNKVEKELIDYYQEVQQLKAADANKIQAELNRQIKKIQLLKVKQVEKSKEEVIEKSNDEFNITNYDDEFSKMEIALAEKKLGFKILLNPKNAVNISITNELAKFKWEEMTFEEKLKLAEMKHMRGYSNFNIKTKNIVAFAEEYYGNDRIKKEKIEKSKVSSDMTEYSHDQCYNIKVEESKVTSNNLKKQVTVTRNENIQIKDDQVPSTSREFANKNSPFTQSSPVSVSRNIEIKSINSKEKELETELIAVQTLKAKKIESLEENKKQFEQQKIAAEAEKMQKVTAKKAKEEKITTDDKKTKKKRYLCS